MDSRIKKREREMGGWGCFVSYDAAAKDITLWHHPIYLPNTYVCIYIYIYI